jgi:hypothetical protein
MEEKREKQKEQHLVEWKGRQMEEKWASLMVVSKGNKKAANLDETTVELKEQLRAQ